MRAVRCHSLEGPKGIAVDEIPAPTAGDLGDEAIEDLATVFIQVEPEREHMAEESSALGDAVAVGVIDLAGAGVAIGLGAVAEQRGEVSDGEHAGAGYGAGRTRSAH